jgi:eukaryotic-like serine/threonine-protein kinase
VSHEDSDSEEEIFDDERSWDDLLAGGLEPGDVLAEKYRVDAIVGYGAMGFVLRAWHLQLDEPVAVKFLLPELAASEEALVRFEREARATFKIKSEHVARVLDVGRLEEGHPFMVMEFLEGEDLADHFYEDPLPIADICNYVAQACEAIAEAHALGIVHRDLKPDNLFLTSRRDGTTCVKVLDFGLSKVLQSSGGRRERAVTAEAQVMGTAHYMSPEQWLSAKNVGPATDIWALGVILYEGLTAESPFLRTNLAAMCNAVLRHDPKPIAEIRAEVPEALTKVVNKCLSKDIEARWASAGELAEALRPFVGVHSLLPSMPPPAASSHAGGRVAAPSVTEIMLNPMPASAVPTSAVPGAVATLPRLGLRQGDLVETWGDILSEAPGDGGRRAMVTLAVVAALILAGLVMFFIL